MQMFRFGRQIHNLTAEKNLLKKKERRGKLIVTETEIKQQKTPQNTAEAINCCLNTDTA